MAISNSLYTRGMKQRLGGAVFYQQAGRTIARELAANVSNPQTPLQMSQRVKWSNLVSFYRANKSWMKKAFETKKRTQSDYNKFMSVNTAMSDIYLTKAQAAAGGCVVAAYRVSEGSLPPVEVYKLDTGNMGTDLFLPIDFVFTDNMTIGEISTALLQSNPGLRIGDQLSFIRETMTSTSSANIPYVQTRVYEIVLEPQSTRLFAEYYPAELMSYAVIDNKNRLCVINNGNAGGFTFVVSRTTGGKTQVSTQSLTLLNMDYYIKVFTSSVQKEAAINSYGVGEDVFLESRVYFPANADTITLGIVGVKVDDEDVDPDNTSLQMNALDETPIEIITNEAVSEGTECRLVVEDHTGFLTEARSPEVDGTSVTFMLSVDGEHLDNYVKRFIIYIGELSFTIPFMQPGKDEDIE